MLSKLISEPDNFLISTKDFIHKFTFHYIVTSTKILVC